jgi:hypothetical protein
MEDKMPDEKTYTIEQFCSATGADKDLVIKLMEAAYEPQEFPKYLGEDEAGNAVVAKSADDHEAHAVKLKEKKAA